MKNWRELSEEEVRVIVGKGTERAFRGKYDKFADAGVYACRRCGAALYRSENKFDSGCGWPAFDAEIAGAVKREVEGDGKRTEILCAVCRGHLGHVFTGEKLTVRNVRHCVNSVSMDFVAAAAVPERFAEVVFAGGCFWGIEYYLQQAQGVIAAVSGYTGGKDAKRDIAPTYKEVCTGKTQFVEAVRVTYDPRQTNYEKLSRLFFEIHDPTQHNGQGPDIGQQYLSVIFYADEKEKQTAQKLIALLREKGLDMATRIEPRTKFWPAEPYHQDYYFKAGKQPYCHKPVQRF